MKKWYQSKTIWVGILEIAAGVIVGIEGYLETGIPITAAGIIQIILRTITKTAILGKE